MSKIINTFDGSCSQDPCYIPSQASEYIGYSESTLAKKRMDGTGPEYLKLGKRKVVYRKSALDRWLDSMKRKNTGEY